MPIDKSWISKHKYNIEYANGLNVFLEFAFSYANGLVHGYQTQELTHKLI